MFSNLTKCMIAKPDTFVALGPNVWCNFTISTVDENLRGGYFDMIKRDARYLLVVKNTHPTDAATVNLLPGDGIWAGKQPSVTLMPGRSAIIQVESGRHKHCHNDEAMAAHCNGHETKGRVFLTTDGTSVAAALFELLL